MNLGSFKISSPDITKSASSGIDDFFSISLICEDSDIPMTTDLIGKAALTYHTWRVFRSTRSSGVIYENTGASLEPNLKGEHAHSVLLSASESCFVQQPSSLLVLFQDKAARNAVCFRYFEGRCKFDDCKFLHVSPSKLTHDERAQVLRELPLREYSKKLAEAIAGTRISRVSHTFIRCLQDR